MMRSPPWSTLQAGGLVVGADPLFGSRCDKLVALAARHAVPAIYASRGFTEAGGLIGRWTANLPAFPREAGIYAGNILNGAKPSDLPVQQADQVRSDHQSARPPRRSASRCRNRSSPAPTRSSSKAGSGAGPRLALPRVRPGGSITTVAMSAVAAFQSAAPPRQSAEDAPFQTFVGLAVSKLRLAIE